MSNCLPVKKNQRFLTLLGRPCRFAAEEGVTNVTSLSVKPSAGLQWLVVAHVRSNDPL